MEMSKFFIVLVVLAFARVNAKRELPKNYGRFEIRNTMARSSPDSVGVHCKRPDLDLPEVQLHPNDALWHDFYADDRVSMGWMCDFFWYDGDSKTVKLDQEFLVWNKNGSSPYLGSCDRCRWKVRESGFFFYKESKTWTLVFEWIRHETQ